jgi:protein tyrosine phosphatase (PTP) superfamily phosphohydrolase (DUF442 family)
VVGVLASAGAVCGFAYGYWAVFDYRFTIVMRDAVYQSAAMPPSPLLKKVARYGIRTVIDLRKDCPEVEAERAALAGSGVRHVHLPSNQVPAPDTVARFLEVMDDPDDLPVLIHCTHGEGRSVLFSAIYRMEYEGWSNEEARRATRVLPCWSSFARDRRKGEFLLGYRPRRGRAVRAERPVDDGGMNL